MSFSSEVKEELARQHSKARHCQVAELAAMIMQEGRVSMNPPALSFETENAIYFRSNLIGPSKEEARIETETFPYIVVKLQYVDKNVVFQ